MQKIAVDIALLLPEDLEKEISSIQTRENIPHISILMGIIEKDILPEITKVIQDYKINKIELEIEEIYKTKLTGSAALKIKKTKELQKLHKYLVDKFKKYFIHKADKTMFYNEEVSERNLKIAENYIKDATYVNFSPHMTLGKNINIEDIKINNLKFNPTGIAVCHIGNHCACRRILYLKIINNKNQ